MDITIYKKRRKQQMLRFFGATALTLLSCRLTMKYLTKTNVAKQIYTYKPNLFQVNHKIPQDIVVKVKESEMKNNKQPGMFSVAMGTVGITSGLFLMGVTGTLWTQNVSTLEEWRLLGNETPSNKEHKS